MAATILQALESEISDLRSALLDLSSEKEALRSLLQDELAVFDLDERLSRAKEEQQDGLGSPFSEDEVNEDEGEAEQREEMEEGREVRDFEGVLVLEEECIRWVSVGFLPADRQLIDDPFSA